MTFDNFCSHYFDNVFSCSRIITLTVKTPALLLGLSLPGQHLRQDYVFFFLRSPENIIYIKQVINQVHT